jgi:hypothetical protein
MATAQAHPSVKMIITIDAEVGLDLAPPRSA